MPLSALVIARNEEKNISECLNSLKFADEIVVILDRSTDKTEKISKNYTKKIFSGSWSQEGDRRNFGIKKCKHEWILEVDADEIIPIKLAAEIKASILQKEFDFFYIRPNTILATRENETTNFQTPFGNFRQYAFNEHSCVF